MIYRWPSEFVFIKAVLMISIWPIIENKITFLKWIHTNAHVYFALDGSLVQRCVVPVVSCVGVRAATQQQADHLRVPERAGVMERDQTAVVAGMDVCSGLQEMLHHVLSAKACQTLHRTSRLKCNISNMINWIKKDISDLMHIRSKNALFVKVYVF